MENDKLHSFIRIIGFTPFKISSGKIGQMNSSNFEMFSHYQVYTNSLFVHVEIET